MRRDTALFLAGFVVLLTGRFGYADNSTFRVASSEPREFGALVTLVFNNEWGSPASNEANRQIDLFLHSVAKTGSDWTPITASNGKGVNIKTGAYPVGTAELVGSGSLQLELHYEGLGVSAGEQIGVTAFWLAEGHRWGWGFERGGSACTLFLPAAAGANCTLQGKGNGRLGPLRPVPRFSSPPRIGR